MRTSVQRIQKRVRVFFRQYERRRVRGLQRQLQSRLCDAPDILHLSHIHIKRHTRVFFMVAVYDANRPGLTGYGVPQIAAFQQSQTDSVFGVQIPQEPIQYFDGISPAFVYVISGMASLQSFHLHFQGKRIAGSGFGLVFHPHTRVKSARATDEHLSLIL